MGLPYPPLHEICLSGFAIVGQNEMDGNHFIVKCISHDQGNMIKFYVMIDSDATIYVFLDKDYTYYYYLPLYFLKSLRNLIIIDG
jgi:hypothetical protein